MLHHRLALGELDGDQPAVGLKHRHRLGRRMLLDVLEHTR
jgi:hypothetical protein